MNKDQNRAKSSDSLTKNYCPSCLQFKNIKKRISFIVEHKREEYDLISNCPDCGRTLYRENKFIDLGGGD